MIKFDHFDFEKPGKNLLVISSSALIYAHQSGMGIGKSAWGVQKMLAGVICLFDRQYRA